MELQNFGTDLFQENNFIAGDPIEDNPFLLFVNKKNGIEILFSGNFPRSLIKKSLPRLFSHKIASDDTSASYFFFWLSDGELLGPGRGEGFKEPTGAISLPTNEIISKIKNGKFFKE